MQDFFTIGINLWFTAGTAAQIHKNCLSWSGKPWIVKYTFWFYGRIFTCSMYFRQYLMSYPTAKNFASGLSLRRITLYKPDSFQINLLDHRVFISSRKFSPTLLPPEFLQSFQIPLQIYLSENTQWFLLRLLHCKAIPNFPVYLWLECNHSYHLSSKRV